MIKYIELTMISGAKYFLVSTEDNPLKSRDASYIISGADTPSIKVNTESNIDSESVYINSRMVESYKLIY